MAQDIMTVKEAVKTAITYTKDLFSDESIMNLGLEEVDFDEKTNEWKVTVGFSRPWNAKKQNLTPVSILLPENSLDRVYKMVNIDADTSKVKSIKNI
jgi:hypothetical protein